MSAGWSDRLDALVDLAKERLVPCSPLLPCLAERGHSRLLLPVSSLAGCGPLGLRRFGRAERGARKKTLRVKKGRGLLVNKNFEPEDYPDPWDDPLQAMGRVSRP